MSSLLTRHPLSAGVGSMDAAIKRTGTYSPRPADEGCRVTFVFLSNLTLKAVPASLPCHGDIPTRAKAGLAVGRFLPRSCTTALHTSQTKFNSTQTIMSRATHKQQTHDNTYCA